MIQPADSEIVSLLKEKDFLEARLNLASGDSIGLVVNLSDSIIDIELKGVNLHSTSIQKICFSNFFSYLSPVEYSKVLGEPLIIKGQRATIEKIPVRIIDAPTDSTGVPLTVFIPDTTTSKKVHLTLLLENGIRIIMVDNETGRGALFIRNIGERIRESLVSLYSVIRIKVPDYHPAIRLYMPGEEIKTIYRAIPNHGRVILRV